MRDYNQANFAEVARKGRIQGFPIVIGVDLTVKETEEAVNQGIILFLLDFLRDVGGIQLYRFLFLEL